MLGMSAGQIKKYEVFVTPLLHGFIGDAGFTPDLTERKSIISQLLNGLQQLAKAKKCHNDIKPSNVLYRKTNNSYSICIADFGQCGGRGGTPGWTAPVFHEERQPGKEDMFSIGWLILRVLSVNQNLFYCLRDNFVADTTKPWIAKFRSLPEIRLVSKMVDLEGQPTVEAIINEWKQISSQITLINRSKLIGLEVPRNYLQTQYVHSK